MKAPEDVAAAPADADVTDSGLASIILTAGEPEGAAPAASDEVTVHYTGWTADGKMFDSSVERGQPATFGLNQVIPGWTEGLQLMKTGEKRRFWIPAALGYGENPGGGRPGGQLTFDVELISIAKAPEAPEGVAEIPSDGERTSSGLVSRIDKVGEGDFPGENDIVTMHFSMWSQEGMLMESSETKGQPIQAPINRLPFEGLKEGLQLMAAGERRTMWMERDLTFGDNAPPGAPEGHIVIEVELLEFSVAPAPPEVPADVAAAPDDAETSASGLAWKVLEPGSDDKFPDAKSTVTVHYTGWTTDGKMFDSSVMRGEPTSFPLNGVIPGWTEGVQLMTVGEKRRFWIPGNLAYGDTPMGGRPGGMLVFDIELLSIQ